MFQNLDIPGPTRRVFPSLVDEEDYTDQYGSAEHEPEYDLSNNLKTKPSLIGIILNKQPSVAPKTAIIEEEDLISPPSARGTHISFPENDVAALPAPGPNAAVSIGSCLTATVAHKVFAQLLLRVGIV